ncbi:hypothetical protein SAY87_018321 [Trapa incisa]|uniref:Uncharacterized protein n=1 Tax=Trapa incisa TaxID=236973 RepID=A0AAN7L575_9MYRT|nr:hypothetical protein SAY87_018321 [Trapa incisa]
MGGKCTKQKDGGGASVIPNIGEIDLYEATYRDDHRLKTFDAALHERTNRVISTLAVDVASQSISFGSLRELTDSQLELNHGIVRTILEYKRDIWDDKDLFRLVEDYFETSKHTLNFCTVLDNCLARARDSQLILQFALKHFEEEKECKGDPHGVRFAKTLTEIEKFKMAGNPFNDEFLVLLQSVSDRQVCLLKRLQERKKKVDKKLKFSDTWMRVSNVVFVAAFVSALIFSVVAAALAAPPVVIALAGVLTAPIGAAGKWVNSLWTNYQKELKAQRELLGLTASTTKVTDHDLENIRVLVDKFENTIESLMQKADIALGGDEVVSLAVNEIKETMEGFMRTVEDLRVRSHKCSQEIRMVRILLQQKLISNTNGD